ncbi:hypothetical protein H696_01580 [Fonticula alba]|uniref:MHD domain-containing protein n=1 Tax=Fonticula alba TaxID=691883 RepID=A0A058ZE26_FONAL|nr:hypothetical protein H696_01580 [Fonticula alba]KCV72178.1 hypothetical protein H696_01580 [Fonticula alba]|eukprot:XP_009493756.1 hypothetical protein H696_01580 [Fonticula alba]
MVLSAVFILDIKGKVLISRNYRGDINMSAIDNFVPLVVDAEDEPPPVVASDGLHFIYIKHNDLYLVGITRKNTNAAAQLVYLHKFRAILEDYFRTLREESIRDNFVLIYELLDETMDFGHPQFTEPSILKEYITQESNALDIITGAVGLGSGIPSQASTPGGPRPPQAVTNAVSWRPEGIRHRKNEVYLDVVESINLLANPDGTVLRSEIIGAIKMRVQLSGMPELRLGLNDKVLFESTGRSTKAKAVELEDVKFHQCVRLSRFDTDRTISFIPPDGEFDLMTYRLNTPVRPLIWVESIVETYSGTRVAYLIKLTGQFRRRSTANSIEVAIPVPDDADTPKFRPAVGSARYAPERGAIIWTIKLLPGGRETALRCSFGLPSVRRAEDIAKRPRPIGVKFEIPYFTTSGLQVRYLKVVERSGYQALPWVRYITKNGDYDIRMAEAVAVAANSESALNNAAAFAEGN